MIKSPIYNSGSLMIKRLFDLLISLPCFVIASPVIILIAIVVRLDSPGNPFFTQVRVGKNGKRFLLYKIRTLYLHHFGIFPGEESPAPHRITLIGKKLRQSKLDELPQLLNIIMGQMSIVGPRPDIPIQVADYTPWQGQRLSLKPGLTGISQVSGNTKLSWPDRIWLDIWYIKNWSWLMDLRIILVTCSIIINGEKFDDDPFHLHGELPGKRNELIAKHSCKFS